MALKQIFTKAFDAIHKPPADRLGDKLLDLMISRCGQAGMNEATVQEAISLLGKGANPDKKDGSGNTPLLWAAGQYGNIDLVKALLMAKAKPDEKRTFDGRTALLDAVCNKRPDLTQILLDNKANPDAKDNTGKTPLMCAILGHDNTHIEILLKAGARLNEQDQEGKTALMHALEMGSPIIQMLLDAGADESIQTLDGKTVLDLAINHYGSRMTLEEYQTWIKNGMPLDHDMIVKPPISPKKRARSIEP